MKKILILSTLVLFIAANTANGQDMYDGYTFSTNDYFGTARSMALGNAVTALGGDLGMIGINPAGSAVSNYGQFAMSFATNTSLVKSGFSVYGDKIIDNHDSSTKTKLIMPNIGYSWVINTGADYGLKSLVIALTFNQTANYNSYSKAHGVNSFSSMFGEMAFSSSDIDAELLGTYNSFYNTNISWDLLTGFQGGLFNRVNEYDYAGVTEAIGQRSDKSLYYYNAGDINQTSVISKSGTKNDVVINFGANISDCFFVGLNLGIPYARYSTTETFYESAVNPELFVNKFVDDAGRIHESNFVQGRYAYQYIADIEGIYAKLGVIYTLGGLRLGAAVQSPTLLSVNERWKNFANVNYSDSYYNASQESPQGEYTYYLRTPMIANFGLAYTFGQAALLSVDYEITNYKSMKFKDINYDFLSNDSFEVVNETINRFAGKGKNLRLGAEFRVNPAISIRAGFNYLDVQELRYYDSAKNYVYASDYQNNYQVYKNRERTLESWSTKSNETYRASLGLGYSSSGSFYLDFAAAVTMYPKSSYNPYYEYPCGDIDGEDLGYIAPSITLNRFLINAVLTLGWRF